MPTPARPLSFASAPVSTEETRALLQERIALYAKTAGLVSYAFLFVGNALAVLLSPRITPTMVLQHPPAYWHLAAATLAVAVWLVTRRGHLEHRTLFALDVGATLGPMAGYGIMAAVANARPEERLDLVVLLIALMTLSMRATIVPSTSRQTAVVGSLASLPVLGVAWQLGERTGLNPGPVLYSALWCVISVIVTTLSSRVIFGLRERAAEARRLGQYVLMDMIGEGGMGTVYRARHALLRRPTAIKLLPAERLGAETVARFEREVQNTSRLTHPNTVAIYDYGRTPQGIFYYAMEYLEGVDLQKLVEQRGPLPESRVVHVLVQVLGALSEAHAAGLVHRDIKPANVVLCERGGVLDTAKVVDFGLVKDVSPGGDATASNVDALIGTPMYMAPEAITSPASVDARADLYALAAVAYFLLTGHTVFEGNTVMDVCAQHLHEAPVPPSERAGRALDPGLEALLLKCLEKNPDDRVQSARELSRALLDLPIRTWTEADAQDAWVDWTAPPESSAEPTALRVSLDARDDQFLSPSK